MYLLAELVKRDFTLRFAGSALGIAWAVLQPLSLVILYWFVFTLVIPQGGRLASGVVDSYALFLISGLLPWIGFNEGIVRGTTSILENAPLVRKLTFRSEVLVLVPNVSAILFELIGLALFGTYLLITGKALWSLWVLPFAIAIQLILQTGLAWILATVHLVFRDVMQVLGFLLSIVFFLSPILYSVPPAYEKFFRWNPLTPLLGLFRSAMLSTPLPPVASIVLLVAFAGAVWAAGLAAFRRMQPSLADLI
ncbi:MAG: ABC transporter permease [Thermoanaerobaculia bacterium]